jgi:hypothetical protein
LSVAALWRRVLTGSPPALERRRIAHPKAQDHADFQSGITAGICDRRNGAMIELRCKNPELPMSALGQ